MLITQTGREVLTTGVPKDIDDIEKLMAGRGKQMRPMSMDPDEILSRVEKGLWAPLSGIPAQRHHPHRELFRGHRELGPLGERAAAWSTWPAIIVLTVAATWLFTAPVRRLRSASGKNPAAVTQIGLLSRDWK